MFGVMRGAPYSSLDCLELERGSSSSSSSSSSSAAAVASKIPKSDAFSIYEVTLQKLRLGARRAFDPSNGGEKTGASSSNPEIQPNEGTRQHF